MFVGEGVFIACPPQRCGAAVSQSMLRLATAIDKRNLLFLRDEETDDTASYNLCCNVWADDISYSIATISVEVTVSWIMNAALPPTD